MFSSDENLGDTEKENMLEEATHTKRTADQDLLQSNANWA